MCAFIQMCNSTICRHRRHAAYKTRPDKEFTCRSVTVGGRTAGLIEVREFLARFVDQTPNLADLEAAFADPCERPHHMQVSKVCTALSRRHCRQTQGGVRRP